jgi:hypothetical protein
VSAGNAIAERRGFYVPGSFPVRQPLKLDFSGTDRVGLEVAAKPVPLGLLRDAASVAEALGRNLVSWNVRDGDRPVPATAGGLASQDPEFIADMGRAYLKAVGEIGRPVPVPVSSTPRVVPPTRKPRARRARSGQGAAQ